MFRGLDMGTCTVTANGSSYGFRLSNINNHVQPDQTKETMKTNSLFDFCARSILSHVATNSNELIPYSHDEVIDLVMREPKGKGSVLTKGEEEEGLKGRVGVSITLYIVFILLLDFAIVFVWRTPCSGIEFRLHILTLLQIITFHITQVPF